jgi:hypothetical protein
MTATQVNVVGLITWIRNVGHKLYMDNCFSSPNLFDNLHTKTINSCGTDRTNQKEMLWNFGKKLKWDDTKTRVWGNKTATIWKDKRNVNMMDMHHPPAEGNLYDGHGNTLRPATVQDYNMHTVVDKSDIMTNSYSIKRHTWKWTKKLLFHLLDLSILNSFTILTSHDS